MRLKFSVPVAQVNVEKISTSGKGSAGLRLINLMLPHKPSTMVEHALEGDTIELTGNFTVQASAWEFFKALVLRAPVDFKVSGQMKGGK